MFKHILVPLDGSHLAEAALTAACEVASKFDSKITLLQVTSIPVIPTFVDGPYYADLLLDLRKKNREEAENYLRGLKKALRQQGYDVYVQVVDDDTPAEAILGVVDGQGMDAVVMSTHGRSGLGRWVYGSVAEKVLRHCDAPVLLIRSKSEPEIDVQLPAIHDEEDLRAPAHR